MEEEVCGMSRRKSKFYFTIKLLWFPALIARLSLFKTLILSAFLILVFNSLRYPFCEGSSCWRSLWGRENTMMSSYFPRWNKKYLNMNDSLDNSQYFLQLVTTKVKSTDMNSLLLQVNLLGACIWDHSTAQWLPTGKADRKLNSSVCKEAAQTICTT